ncbi:hypothetical protein BJV77DRAFT_1063623 [Russula vinacea]|nr:hypothetical protein BJV77DRAFT_1063623 [Russula vinacea]
MGAPYVWPYYYPQQQHPYFQYPPTSADYSGSGHRSSRSWQGSPHRSPPVLPTLLPVAPAAPPVVTPVYQPALLHPNYSRSRRHSFDAAFVPVQPVSTASATPWPTVPAPYYTYSPGWAMGPMELPRPQLHNLINGEIVALRLWLPPPHDAERIRARAARDAPADDARAHRVRHDPAVARRLQVLGTSLSPPAAVAPRCRVGPADDRARDGVARAYTRRYKSSGSDWAERQQQAEGVKRIDFLLKTTWFKGFTWLDPENGVERLKLLVGMES